ncbi:uncharacterized protein DNG_01725 [Cephalotrichum gorgonifer]|uniref:B30.2/SPRY domain-containing protein n=1 Tax=Cephalotrichum gorgonifer TaxID=2041049 RepID=A0AAE8MS80_9PEZI|nr:uncharacterized protein DNG_01725 [Cephalotrichum gorgonifer]
MTEQHDTEFRPLARREYRIYLVGFPERSQVLNTLPIPTVIEGIVPEAEIVRHDIFRGDPNSRPADVSAARKTTAEEPEDQGTSTLKDDISDGDVHADSASATSVAAHNFFTPEWIEEEGVQLLSRIQKHARSEETGDRPQVVLAGHGLGGVIVKQAIVVANTDPRFYDTSLDVASLIFFTTPHRATASVTWEEVLSRLLRATGRNRQAHLLSGIVDFVSRLPLAFYRFASKYAIVNFVQAGNGSDNFKFNNDIEEVVGWSEREGRIDAATCVSDNLAALASLRKHFAPRQFDNLRSIYHTLTSSVSLKSMRGGSVQVIGTAGLGKSALVKLISQDIMQESPVVIIENFNNPPDQPTRNLYSVYVSFVHQIISQRPSLFRPVHNRLTRLTREDVWMEKALLAHLTAILLLAKNVDFLIVIYDWETWPAVVRSWWCDLPGLFSKSSGSAATFLISSQERIHALSPEKTRPLNMAEKYPRYKHSLIRTRTRQFLGPPSSATPVSDDHNQEVRKKIIETARGFEGSFTATNQYMTSLFDSFTLSTPNALRWSIQRAPATEEALYESYLKLIQSRQSWAISWATIAVSWVLRAVRPLRIEELNVAAAVSRICLNPADIKKAMSITPERDLRAHLSGLVTIEDGTIRIVSPLAKTVLCKTDLSPFVMETDYTITLLCLHYLGVILSSDSPDIQESLASYVSFQHRRYGPPQPVLELLSYACQFWHVHFLRVDDPDEPIKEEVAEFLKSGPVAGQWFDLHLLCAALRSSPLSTEDRVPSSQKSPDPGAEAISKDPGEDDTARSPGPEGAEATEHSTSSKPDGRVERPTPTQMACYLGLSAVLPYLSEETEDGACGTSEDQKPVTVRRGPLERRIIPRGIPLKYQLECAIAEDNATEVEAVLASHPETAGKYFPLHTAALKGSLQTVQALVGLGYDSSQRNGKDRTPLHMAALCGDTEVIRYLLTTKPISYEGEEEEERDVGLNPALDATDNNNQTPLILATRMGHVEAADLLARSRSSLALRDRTGKTAVHYAVLSCPHVIQAFLKTDEEAVFVRDDLGCTPLHVAARLGHGESVNALLEAAHRSGRHTDFVEAIDRKGKSALHHAGANGAVEVARILLGEGAIVEARDSDGKLAADLAAEHGHLETMKVIAGEALAGGNQLLVAASGAGQLLVVRYLLQHGVPGDGEGEQARRTPISAAAEEGWLSVVLALLQYDIRVNLVDSDRRTPLHYAARNGRLEVGTALLAHKVGTDAAANVNAPDYRRYTPLHLAARQGHVEFIELLLKDRGDDIDKEARSREGEAPLHVAVGHPRVVELLLGLDVVIDSRDAMGGTPLHRAVIEGHAESALLLLGQGADISAKDDNGNTARQYSIRKNLVAVLEESHRKEPAISVDWSELELAVTSSALDVLKFLASKCPNATTMEDGAGRTLLSHAARCESAEVVSFLLDSGSDVDHAGRWKRTPLLETVMAGQLEIAKILIERGAQVDKADEDGLTPLYAAAERGSSELITAILGAGAAVDVRTASGKTPLYIAAYRGKVVAVSALLAAGADLTLADADAWTPLHAAADNVEVSQLLAEKGADVNCKQDSGRTPLHFAASWGYADVMKVLLQNGGDVNVEDDGGVTPFFAAVLNGNTGVISTMLSREGDNVVDIDKPNSHGMTALHKATEENKPDVLRILISHGADITAETPNGSTSLDLAIHMNRSMCVRALLEMQDSPDRGNETGKGRWPMETLVKIYWKAITGLKVESVKVLLEVEPSLLDEESEDGWNGLETCMKISSPQDLVEELADVFLHSGVDPFKRRREDQPSAFERGIVSRGRVRNNLLGACLRQIPKDRTEWPLPFEVLRVATELDDDQGLLKGLGPDIQRLAGRVDRDGWSLDHFLYQAAPRLRWEHSGLALSLADLKTSPRLIWPPSWHTPEVEARACISEDGLEATFTGASSKVADLIISLRADSPLPPRDLGIPYFEVSFKASAEEQSPEPVPTPPAASDATDPEAEAKQAEPNTAPAADARPETCFSVGLVGEFTDQTMAHPGWWAWSVGYHGDSDGGLFEQSGAAWRTDVASYGPGQTVGCGVDYESKEYFFTLDGEVVARRHSDSLIFRKLYPCVGHSGGGGSVTANFGAAKFVWQDAEKLLQREKAPPQPGIKRTATAGGRDRSGGSHEIERSRSRERPRSRTRTRTRVRSRSRSRSSEEYYGLVRRHSRTEKTRSRSRPRRIKERPLVKRVSRAGRQEYVSAGGSSREGLLRLRDPEEYYIRRRDSQAGRSRSRSRSRSRARR